MPFASSAQRKWMHANEPEMAKRWEKHTPKGKKLPKKKTKSEAVRSRIDAVLEGKRPVHSTIIASEFDCQLDFALNQLFKLAGENSNDT